MDQTQWGLADLGPGRVVLELENEVICSAKGDVAGTVPEGLAGELEGRVLLDLVHPLDRPLVGKWLDTGLGTSQPFRRAAPDEPARWFRLLATEPAPGVGKTRVLLEEISQQEQAAARQVRLLGILARQTGEELLTRGATIAAELVGASHAWLGEHFGPLFLVRSVYGDALDPFVGVTLPLAGDPASLASSGGLVRRFGPETGGWQDSPLVRRAKPTCGVVLPLGRPPRERLRGSLVVAFREDVELGDSELELLLLLAARLSLELARQREDRPLTSDVAGIGLQAALDALANALANVLTAAELNCDLVLQEHVSETVRARLVRVLEMARRGHWLTRTVSGLGGFRQPAPSLLPVERLLRGAEDVIRLGVEGVRVEVDTPRNAETVLADEGFVLAGVLLAAIPLALGPHTPRGIRLTARSECDENGLEWCVLRAGVEPGAAAGAPWRERGAGGAIEWAAEIVARQGGQLHLEEGSHAVQVAIRLPLAGKEEVQPEAGFPRASS